jgi:hypothetical protein
MSSLVVRTLSIARMHPTEALLLLLLPLMVILSHRCTLQMLFLSTALVCCSTESV